MANEIYIDRVGETPTSLKVFNLNTQRIHSYPFKEVTKKELMELRLGKKPGCVYKKADKLYYTAIPKKLSFVGKAVGIGTHLCGVNCTMVCKGCPRTGDLTVSHQEKNGKKWEEAVIASWRIEKYPSVLEGFEAFNMAGTSDAFIVMECANYQERKKKTTSSTKPPRKLILDLANFIWPDFDGNLKELRLRISEQERKQPNDTRPYRSQF